MDKKVDAGYTAADALAADGVFLNADCFDRWAAAITVMKIGKLQKKLPTRSNNAQPTCWRRS